MLVKISDHYIFIADKAFKQSILRSVLGEQLENGGNVSPNILRNGAG